mmetsp:Transcript_21987/g.48865  ORF Transcript_21987/g.48865 Transcript_21987/m.48865 type:complete len:231 (-) Transcript_21987:150-842(-)
MLKNQPRIRALVTSLALHFVGRHLHLAPEERLQRQHTNRQRSVGQSHHDACIYDGAVGVGQHLHQLHDGEDPRGDGPTDDHALAGGVKEAHAVGPRERVVEDGGVLHEGEGALHYEGRELALESLVPLCVAHVKRPPHVQRPLEGQQVLLEDWLDGDGIEPLDSVGENGHHLHHAPHAERVLPQVLPQRPLPCLVCRCNSSARSRNSHYRRTLARYSTRIDRQRRGGRGV